jgi:Zn-dependent M28 family amino/carboxypeptidase
VTFDEAGIDFQSLKGLLVGFPVEFGGRWRYAQKPQLIFSLAAPTLDLAYLLSQIDPESTEWYETLTAQGKVRMHLILTSQTAEDVSTFNVVADLKGSEHPEQIVIVSGHLDSWDLGTGAIDDAAGVAVAMETAQLLQQLHLRPKRTLRVIAWIDEENLGRGHAE